MAADTTAQKKRKWDLDDQARAIQRQPTRLQRQPMSFPAKRHQPTTLHPTRAIVVILERLL